MAPCAPSSPGERFQLKWMLRRHRSVPVARFDAPAGRWVNVEAAPAVERDTLTLATFNIWFSDHRSGERYDAIADLLSVHDPDVIVFQEVTPEAREEFLARPWIREHYYRASATGKDFGNHGLLILSRLPFARVSYTRVPASAGRGLLQARLTINGRTMAICSVHLESGKAASRLRARQLDRVFRTVDTAEDVVLLGDFNMRDAENGRIPDRYVDAWPALRPHDDGFTEDTAVNAMLRDSKNKRRRVRFDRVLVKDGQWTPDHIELLGTTPISSASPRVFPSDHFGLLCRVVRAAPDTDSAGG